MIETKAMPSVGNLSNGHKVSSLGAGVAVLCFFLPWVMVSCGNQPIASFSGWQLAAGTSVGSGFGASQLPGTPILFLALLAGAVVLALAYLALRRGRLTRLDGFGPIGLGSLTLLVLFAQFNTMQGEMGQQGVTATTQYGLWGTVLGYLAVVAGGIMNVRQPTQTVYMAAPLEGAVATDGSFIAAEGSPAPAPVRPQITIPPNVQLGRVNFDLTTLRKALRWPLIIAAALCLIVLVNASLGSFWSVAFILAWAFAGLSYTRAALTTGASLQSADLAVNGGALGVAAAIVYKILVQIVFSLQNRGNSFDLPSTLATLVEAFIVGALAALAWYAYQQERPSLR